MSPRSELGVGAGLGGGAGGVELTGAPPMTRGLGLGEEHEHNDTAYRDLYDQSEHGDGN